METISGIEIFPIIAFLIFFTFFVGLIIYAMRLSKSNVDEMSNLPFEEGFETNHINQSSHE
jgi:cbb3-type cytochrome oxidase subunit 3